MGKLSQETTQALEDIILKILTEDRISAELLREVQKEKKQAVDRQLVMRTSKLTKERGSDQRAVIKVDPYVHEIITEVSRKTRKSMMTVANEMLQFAYESIVWEE